MTEKVRSQTGLARRGAVYQFRMRVPEDVREYFQHRTEVTQSLRTKDPREAKQRCQIELLKFTQQVESYRALKKATQGEAGAGQHQAPRNVAPVELSETDCERLAAIWQAQTLDSHRWAIEWKMIPTSEDELEAVESEWLQTFAEPLESVNTRLDIHRLVPHLRELLGQYGLNVSEKSPSFQRLALAVARKAVDALPFMNRMAAGYFGDIIPRAQDLPLPPVVEARAAAVKGESGETLADLVDYWEKRREPSPRTAQETRHAFDSLQRFNPDQVLTPSTVEKRHIVAFKDALLDDGKAPNTVRKQLNLVKAVFALARANDKIERDPAERVSVEKGKATQKERIPFSPADLRAIFSTPVYTEGQRPEAGCGEASYWLPLLALYTGARMEELAQMLTADVKQEGAIDYLHLTDILEDDERQGNNPRKKLKNESSRRRVPVHPDLVKLGFLRYVEAMRAAGSPRLFPLITHGSGDKRQQSANYSKWFGRYLREVAQVTDRRKVFHSFRHGFKDTARVCGITPECHHAITGHSTGNEGDKYGDEYYPLPPLAEAMQKLAYPGLTLPSPWQMPPKGLALTKAPSKRKTKAAPAKPASQSPTTTTPSREAEEAKQ